MHDQPGDDGQGLSEALPPAYLTALLMRGAGRPDAEIAARLDVPVESVAAMILIATRKATRTLGLASDGPVVG